MAASLSRPDPSSPASVAEAGFATSRRGYQQDEVRAFLVSVAAELGRLQERERQLDAELADARAAADGGPHVLDEAAATELLGEETVRVLQTARESASQIKIRAEENAARILRDANDEANRLRQETEVDVARRRQEATAEAEAEVALAKQQGREMVNEARAYRERVLADLERRTTLARKQIEELIHGRDRLLQVFERARLVAVDVTSELRDIDTPDELVNLTPTTGPVPIMVPNRRRERPEPVEPEATPVESAPESDSGAPDTAEPESGAPTVVDTLAEPDAEPDAAVDEVVEVDAEPDAAVDEVVEADETDATPTRQPDANVVSLFRGRPVPVADEDDQDDQDDDEDDEAIDGTRNDAEASAELADVAESAGGDAVGGLFARLRDELPAEPDTTIDDTTIDDTTIDDTTIDDTTIDDTTIDDTTIDDTAVTTEDAPAAGTDLDTGADLDTGTGIEDQPESAFTRRDEALVPLIVGAARKIKRVLADEQNLVLDTLRQKEPVTALDDLVPELDEHTVTYREAISDELIGAAAAGAAELGVADTKSLRNRLGKAGALDDATALVRTALIGPLRDRLERSIADGDGDNEVIAKRIRSVYREWKTQHIDTQLDDVFRYAHGGGLAVTIEPGTPVVWTIDPSEPACPDCEDNSLSGAVPAGESFATGHTQAPAHPGCRCIVLPQS